MEAIKCRDEVFWNVAGYLPRRQQEGWIILYCTVEDDDGLEWPLTNMFYCHMDDITTFVSMHAAAILQP